MDIEDKTYHWTTRLVAFVSYFFTCLQFQPKQHARGTAAGRTLTVRAAFNVKIPSRPHPMPRFTSSFWRHRKSVMLVL